MKLIFTLIIIFLVVSMAHSQKGYITFSGTIHVFDQPNFGKEGMILLVKGSEWNDTVLNTKIHQDGKFSFSLRDSLINYQFFFSKPGYSTQHIQVYPELGDYKLKITLVAGGPSPFNTSNEVEWLSENKTRQQAAYYSYRNIQLQPRLMVDFFSDPKNAKTETTPLVPFDLSMELTRLEMAIAAESDGVIKSILFIEYTCIDALQQKVQFRRKAGSTNPIPVMFTGNGKTELLREAINHIPANSGLWNLQYDCITWLMKKIPADSAVLNFVENIMISQSTAAIKAATLHGLAQQYHQQDMREEFARAFTTLATEFKSTHSANKAKFEFALFSNLVVGKPVPQFAVASLDDNQAIVTPGMMNGKTYLIEYWTLWCTGCIQAIPQLQKIFKRYEKKGFEIFSIYLDNRTELVKQFRRQKFPMPWLHGYDPAGFKGQLARDFEVSWVPRSVLVGPDGIILAIDPTPGQVEEILSSMF